MITPVTLEQSARDYRDLVTAACTKRKIVGADETVTLGFQMIAGKLLKVVVVVKTPDLCYTWHTHEIETTAPAIEVLIGLATEGDLIAARKIARRAQYAAIDD